MTDLILLLGLVVFSVFTRLRLYDLQARVSKLESDLNWKPYKEKS